MTLLRCSNKGCFQQGEHKLDVNTNEVTCEYCGGPVEVTIYMKKILRSSGQISKKAVSSHDIKCSSCTLTGTPVLMEYLGGRWLAACRHCKAPHSHLSKYFIEALKLNPDIERTKTGLPFPGEKPKAKPDAVPEVRAAPAPPPARKAPRSAQEMVKLAAAKLAQAESDKPKVRPKPKTAAEMLARAGVPLATPQE